MTSEQEAANLESLPEDIIPMIVEYIRSWAEIKVVGADAPQRRQIARKSRDSALHAWAMSSKENHRRVLPHLLQDLTLTIFSLGRIFPLFIGQPLLGRFVKSLKIHVGNDDETDDFDLLLRRAQYSEQYGKMLSETEIISELLQAYLLRWPNIHTLILAGSTLSFPLVDFQRNPFHCLTFSLKRLWVGAAATQLDRILLAQNMVWILAFCPNLRQAVLFFGIDLASFDYLQEYSDHFGGLSNVEQLVIAPIFIWNDGIVKRPRWRGHGRRPYHLVGDNLETHAIHNFLKVTKNLSSCEIYSGCHSQLYGKKVTTRIYSDCIQGLFKSYHSLKHLRLMLLNFDQDAITHFSVFKNLKILSLDMMQLKRMEVQICEPSKSVKILHLPYYWWAERGGDPDSPQGTEWYEDRYLSNVIDKEIFPTLEEICLPSNLVTSNRKFSPSPLHLKFWNEMRQTLKEHEAIKSGRIKLEFLELGEIVGDVTKGENCLSFADWISPFPV